MVRFSARGPGPVIVGMLAIVRKIGHFNVIDKHGAFSHGGQASIKELVWR